MQLNFYDIYEKKKTKNMFVITTGILFQFNVITMKN